MNKYKYVVASGWWCDNDSSRDREVKYGNRQLRKVDFFESWYRSVLENCNPQSICIVDSNSPIKPDFKKYPSITWIELERNAGHSTMHEGKYCGVSLSFITSMMHTYCTTADYWVYIEQDALMHGRGIIEHAIDNMKGNIMYGSGIGTPQPVQQSMIIIKKDYIPKFIFDYCNIKSKDSEISPEYKFAISTTPILKALPESLFQRLDRNNLYSKILAKFVFLISNSFFSKVSFLPFGYGRCRPINYKDQYFYFQHGNEDELIQYSRLKIDDENE